MAPVEGTEKVSLIVKSTYVLIMRTDRCLKMWVVSMAGEGKQRKAAQDIIGDTVLGETTILISKVHEGWRGGSGISISVSGVLRGPCSASAG